MDEHGVGNGVKCFPPLVLCTIEGAQRTVKPENRHPDIHQKHAPVNQEIGEKFIDMAEQIAGVGHPGIEGGEQAAGDQQQQGRGQETDCGKGEKTTAAEEEHEQGDKMQKDYQEFQADLEKVSPPALLKGGGQPRVMPADGIRENEHIAECGGKQQAPGRSLPPGRQD